MKQPFFLTRGTRDVVQIVHRTFAVVLQVRAPPLDLGICAVPRMSDDSSVDRCGASEVPRESYWRIRWKAKAMPLNLSDRSQKGTPHSVSNEHDNP